jgi:HEPN domain-containing protein
MNRTDFQQLAAERVRDARALLAAKRWSAAYYVAGYAVEFALKACIARLVKAEQFPDKGFAEKCWTHDIERLVFLAGLREERNAESAADPVLTKNWEAVKDWTEASRYVRTSKTRAELLYDAITDKKHGVLPWIKHRW